MQEIRVPRLGESITEVTIIQWIKKTGDLIKKDDVLVRVSTDKVDSEIVSPYDGVLKEIFHLKDEIVEVNAILAVIEASGENSIKNAMQRNDSLILKNPTPEKHNKAFKNENEESIMRTPVAASFILQNGISDEYLVTIAPKNKNNKIYKKDLVSLEIQNHSSNQQRINIPKTNSQLNSNLLPEDIVIELTRSRKIISEKMQKSNDTIPHVTSVIDADVSSIVKWREMNKDFFVRKYNVKITYTSFFIKAIANALVIKPQLNSYFLDNKIILKKKINIGIAVSTKIGDLIVPVIKNVADKDIIDIAKDLASLTTKAREGTLNVDEISEATYTVSNIGTFGNVFGTPLISIPQVAVMAIGAIGKKTVVIKDEICLKNMVYLSHSYDHRIIDGHLGGEFAQIVAQELASFNLENLSSMEK